MIQDDLAKKYNYRCLPDELSQTVRKKYRESIPPCLCMNGGVLTIRSLSGTVIANGYDRIVIGDYGAFIEFSKEQVVLKNIKVKKGQEYRINDKNFCDKVKYIWLTAKDESDVKIYFQRRSVPYADYKVDKYYVSPNEILL